VIVNSIMLLLKTQTKRDIAGKESETESNAYRSQFLWFMCAEAIGKVNSVSGRVGHCDKKT